MASSPPEPSLVVLADRLRRASRLTILTGAGVSAASGVPTFRGAEGLWRRFRPEELATPQAFARDPVLVWEWYAWRRELVGRCLPNTAHQVIAGWSRGVLGRTAGRAGCLISVITQNVDDLHLRAGTRQVIRLHGSLWELRCTGREAGGAVCRGRWRDESIPFAEFPPVCRNCGGLARPAVVWFGESLEERDLTAAISACACDVFLTVGTSAQVHPAAGLVHRARRHGAFTAAINLEPTDASHAVDVAIHGAAEVVLPALDALLTVAPSPLET